MSKTMTQQSYDKILEAAKILCEYCENNACENCQVTKLTEAIQQLAKKSDGKLDIKNLAD